jgi:hypothetical protein
MLRLSDKPLLKVSPQIEGMVVKKVALEIEKVVFRPVTSTVDQAQVEPLATNLKFRREALIMKMVPKVRTAATESDSHKTLLEVDIEV